MANINDSIIDIIILKYLINLIDNKYFVINVLIKSMIDNEYPNTIIFVVYGTYFDANNPICIAHNGLTTRLKIPKISNIDDITNKNIKIIDCELINCILKLNVNVNTNKNKNKYTSDTYFETIGASN